MQQVALRLFDVDLLLESNDTKLIELFQRFYYQLAIVPAELREPVRRSRFVHSESETTLQIGDTHWQLSASYPKFVHNLIWYDAVQHIRSHLLLHAAGIAYNGEGSLLVGHSMSGKTTLSLALMQEGATLLTDDAISIDYAKGELHAVARQVQIRPKTYRLLNLPAPPVMQPSPAYPLKNLFILGNGEPEPAHQMLLDIDAAPSAWEQQLQQHPSVQQLTLTPVNTGWLCCRLVLNEPAARCYPAIEQLCAIHGVLIYDVRSVSERVPTFGVEAVTRPIPPSEAAFQILPHIQNRTLANQFGGEMTLYLTILTLLQHTRCYHLQVGTPENTSREVFDLLSR
jgi:hypothetical protein